MERIKTLETRDLCESAKTGGCGECQTSCQSACKTSCGVANQKCENTDADPLPHSTPPASMLQGVEQQVPSCHRKNTPAGAQPSHQPGTH